MNAVIKTPHDALVYSLALAILAPTDAVAERALRLAMDFAGGMDDGEVETAKRQAEFLAGTWPHHGNPEEN